VVSYKLNHHDLILVWAGTAQVALCPVDTEALFPKAFSEDIFVTFYSLKFCFHSDSITSFGLAN
jgi:hypothetical protein